MFNITSDVITRGNCIHSVVCWHEKYRKQYHTGFRLRSWTYFLYFNASDLERILIYQFVFQCRQTVSLVCVEMYVVQTTGIQITINSRNKHYSATLWYDCGVDCGALQLSGVASRTLHRSLVITLSTIHAAVSTKSRDSSPPVSTMCESAPVTSKASDSPAQHWSAFLRVRFFLSVCSHFSWFWSNEVRTFVLWETQQW